MQAIIFLLAVFLIFCNVSCTEKDARLNWSPTPIITSVEVIDSPQLPKNRIDYSTLGETLAKVSIKGVNFSDQYDSIESVQMLKDDKSIGGDINLVTSNEIQCTLDLWMSSFGGPGTYMVSVKTRFSAWSNSMPVTIY